MNKEQMVYTYPVPKPGERVVVLELGIEIEHCDYYVVDPKTGAPGRFPADRSWLRIEVIDEEAFIKAGAGRMKRLQRSVTPEEVVDFCRDYYDKHGTKRGSQAAAAVHFGVSPSTISRAEDEFFKA